MANKEALPLLNPDDLVGIPPLVQGGILTVAAGVHQMTLDDLAQQLLYNPMSLPQVINGRMAEQLRSIPPHSMASMTYGPRRSDVLVVGKLPQLDDIERSRLNSGDRGQLLMNLLNSWNVNYADWLFTNACWHWVDAKSVPEKAYKEWQYFLAKTINIARPKFILMLGADAVKKTVSLFDPMTAKGLKFKNARGTTLSYRGIQLMPCIAPGNVLQDPSTRDDFIQDMKRFCGMLGSEMAGVSSAAVKPQYTIHEVDSVEKLTALVDHLLKYNVIRYAIDCEWAGDVQTGKLRTIQIAWSDREGAVIILRRCGMVDAFTPNVNAAFIQLQRLLCRPEVGIYGHNAKGDLQWLAQHGLNLWTQFISNGFDTMLGYHEVYEAMEKQLELVAMRMLGMDRYDQPLRKWLTDNGYNKDDVEEQGYGMVPDHILHPYAVMDAIATFALVEKIIAEIMKWPGLWEHYQSVVHPVNLAIDEMEMNGVLIDADRVRTLASLVEERLATLVSLLRKNYNWPEFNPGSPDQVSELLYGRYKFKDGKPNRKSPPDSVCFNLKPVKSTDKPRKSIPWERVEAMDPVQQLKYSPSTDQESVRILMADQPALRPYVQWKTIDQLRKNFLRSEVENDAGDKEFEKGIGSWIGHDGRLRTHFRLTLETGRYATSPNLQNWPKRTEPDVRRCFLLDAWYLSKEGPDGTTLYFTSTEFSPDRSKAYIFKRESDADIAASVYGCEVVQMVDTRYHTLRSVMMASPGYVLVEPDWNQAELWTMGACAHDDDFLHVLATSDLHTVMMQKMFSSMMYHGQPFSAYDVKTLRKYSKTDKYVDSLRTAAKTVNFGIPYGRGAGAIIREIKKQGIRDRTNQEAQGWIDTFYQTFPKIYHFLEACKLAASNPGYVRNPFNRYRRFPPTSDRELLGDFQREAVNFPIQSTVGDAMSVALRNLWVYKRYVNTSVDYRLLLSIHDAVLMEVPTAHVEQVVETVIPACMVQGVEVPGLGLHYGIGDIDIQLRWGEKSPPQTLLDLGLPKHLCGFKN